MEEEKKAKNDTSVMAKLTAKIIDSLQIRIKHVHIRFEDHSSCPGHPFGWRDSGEAARVLPHGGQRGVHTAAAWHDAEEGARDAVWRVLGLRREFAHPRRVGGDAPAGNELRLRRPEERARRPPRRGAAPLDPLDGGAHLAVAAREGRHAEGGAAQTRGGRGDRERGDGAGRVGADRRDNASSTRTSTCGRTACADGRRRRSGSGWWRTC